MRYSYQCSPNAVYTRDNKKAWIYYYRDKNGMYLFGL